MKPISSRPIFTLSLFTTANHRIIKNSHYLAFSTQTHQTTVSRRHEDESRAVRVSVWWDFENCNLPLNTNVFKVAQSITNAVRANGIKGPIQITAFGDVMQMSRTNQEALSSTGINLTHVPAGGKNSADRSLLVDLMYWVSQNPPPAHLLLISGDRDFAGILHRLRMNNYNILLASPDSAPSVLCSAATIMWQWSSLLKGENLTGKLFNQPPDGPYGSWYGYYKAPLEDPYAVTEQSFSDELSELASDTKRPIPKVVKKHIRQILSSYPEGIPITQLRTELTKSNLTIDKDLYGYKKFSRFLLAMPNVLKLHSANDGQFLVQGVSTKLLDELAVTYVGSATNNGGPEVGGVAKLNGETSHGEYVAEKSTLPQSMSLQELQKEEKQNEYAPSVNMQGIKGESSATSLHALRKEEKLKESTLRRNTLETQEQDRKVKLKEPSNKVEVASPVGENGDFSEKNVNHLLVPDEHRSASVIGIFRRMLKKLFRSGDIDSSEKCDGTLSGKDHLEGRSAAFVNPALFSPSSHEALIDGEKARTHDGVTHPFNQGSSLSDQIMCWFKFQSPPELDKKEEKTGEMVDQINITLKNPEIFSKESFWNELKSFIQTSRGAATFTQSRTREHLAQNLQKHGPPILRSLPEGAVLHLIDLLISDKKLVEECNSWAFPFRLTRPVGKDPQNNNANGLSHIFSNLQESGKYPNPPHSGVPQPVSHRGSSSKPRSEILADCQKLVDHIIKEYPEGFNMGSFRKLFLEKNGYPLDLQKLGYDKLVNLLHSMPGVRIESSLIVPAAAFKNLDIQNVNPPPIQDRESSISSNKDDDSDSSWDELGPVDKSGPNEEMDTRKAQSGRSELKVPDYEPLEEDEFSDSEEEATSSTIRLENETKSSLKDDESSLLQILDSWYSSKGGNNAEATDIAEIRSSTSSSSPSSPQTAPGTKNECLDPTSLTKKQKHVKCYSFVSDEHVDSKDRLVDGILGSLKKSSEKSADSRLLG